MERNSLMGGTNYSKNAKGVTVISIKRKIALRASSSWEVLI